MDTAVIVLYVAIGLAVVVIVALGVLLYCCCTSMDEEEVQIGTLTDGLLRREDLEDTFLEGKENSWQCVVCAYTNNATRKTCLMCGTSSRFFVSADQPLMRNKSSRTFLSNNGDEDSAAEEDLRARQRALFKRRLNSMAARKNLSQRQRGAFRRRIWERKQLNDGKFHWIRQNSTDDVSDSMLSQTSNGSVNNMGETTTLHAGPHGESVQDYHKLRSQGFVWQYDDLGRLTWTQAENVAINMDSFNDMKLGDNAEAIDFEGIMAMDFRMKKQWFLVQLSRIATPVSEAVAKLTITRENIMEESINRITGSGPDALRTYLKITFAGEPGIDAGGLLREWFGIVCKEIFSDRRGLFLPTKGEDMSYWINPVSGEKNVHHLREFRFAGILIGKALFEGLVLDVHLALPLLKHVLGIPISFSDLEFLDMELHRNCQWLRNNTQVENLCLTFTIMLESGQEIELKPDGANIDVTDENKDEYLRLLLEHRMLESISAQLQEFLTGIYDVVPKALLSVFDYQELELILCGIPTIDTADWRANTHVRYIKSEEDKKHKISEEEQNGVLQWFWLVIESLTPEERARLLQFATGTSRVPVEGFKGLMSSSGIIHPFTLQLHPRGADSSSLFPKAHTCFNRLDLPMYRSMEEMETYLSMVLQMEILGFGLE